MELKQTIQCTTRVSASLEEGAGATAKVFASAEYAKGRTTTVEVSNDELPPSLRSKLSAVLEEIRAFAEKPLGDRIGRAIHTSAAVAAAHREI
jgi:hypothetical protein